MRRLILFFAIALLGCGTFEPALMNPSVREKTGMGQSPALEETPPADLEEQEAVGVSPLCTLVGNEDTRTEEYGQTFELHWGWDAMTKQQVLDYIENAVIRVTFDGKEITDATQGDVYEDAGIYRVLWWKRLGVLDRGTYEMTYFVEYKTVIFDGWQYYGPETENAATEDRCYLVVE